MLCIGVCCWYYNDITCQSVGLCIILTNPANMNEHRQTGFKSYGFAQSCYYTCIIGGLVIIVILHNYLFSLKFVLTRFILTKSVKFVLLRVVSIMLK